MPMNDQQMKNEGCYDRRAGEAVAIDPKNLFGHLLIKWKTILAVAVVFAVIGGIAGFIRSGKAAEKQSGQEMAELVNADLTAVQKDEAQRYSYALIAFDKAIDEQKNFNDESFIMNLDAATAVGCRNQYLLEADIEDAPSAYDELLSDEDCQSIEDILGSFPGRKGIGDAVQVIPDTSKDTYNLISHNADTPAGETDRTYKFMLNILVVAPDKDICDKIADIADEAVMRKTDELAANSAVVCTKIADKVYDPGAEASILLLKQKYTTYLTTLTTNKGNFVNNAVLKVDEKERDYIYSLIADDTKTAPAAAQQSGRSLKSALKTAILGFFGGAFLALCLFVISYIIGGKLHVAEELAYTFGVPALQTLTAKPSGRSSGKGDIITKWGRRLAGEGEASADTFAMLMEEVRKNAEKGIKSVYIAADGNSEDAKSYARKISEGSGDGISFYAGSLVPDAEDIKQLLSSDGVLLIPVIESTKMRTISAFTDICTRNGKCIIGSAPVCVICSS